MGSAQRILGLVLCCGIGCASTPQRTPEQDAGERRITRHRFAPTHIVGRPVPTLANGELKPIVDPLTGLSAGARRAAAPAPTPRSSLRGQLRLAADDAPHLLERQHPVAVRIQLHQDMPQLLPWRQPRVAVEYTRCVIERVKEPAQVHGYR